jgi:urease accessory protein
MKKHIAITVAATGAMVLAAGPAAAHVGVGGTSSFAAGVLHPLSGFDHILAMVAVGSWAALKGGKALWVWPCAFVGVMLAGGALGMAGLPLPFVEPGIAASIVVLGILVALAVDLPVAVGAAIIGVFALFHGHAHGTEMPVAGTALLYAGGFALATAALHGAGIGLALISRGALWRSVVRGAGAACACMGIALSTGVL